MFWGKRVFFFINKQIRHPPPYAAELILSNTCFKNEWFLTYPKIQTTWHTWIKYVCVFRTHITLKPAMLYLAGSKYINWNICKWKMCSDGESCRSLLTQVQYNEKAHSELGSQGECKAGTRACFNGCDNLPWKDVKAIAPCCSMPCAAELNYCHAAC